MKTSKTITETTENPASLDREEQALAKAAANKQAADAELDAKVAEGERLDAELQADLAADLAANPDTDTEPKTVLMACDHACDKCGNCPDRTPQTVDNDDLAAILEQPCDCEVVNAEVKHVRIATETKAA